jgi:hypothetical protein
MMFSPSQSPLLGTLGRENASAKNQGQDEKHKEQEEQELRNPCCGPSDTAKSQHGGNQRNNQENNCPA